MHMIMAYGFYKYFHGVREQRYVSRRLPTTLLIQSPTFFQPSLSNNPLPQRKREHSTKKLLTYPCNNSELAREKIWSRLYLTPLLQAEEDRDQVRRHLADKAREKELLGTEQKIYNSDRFIRPTYVYTPSKVTQ